MSNETPSSIGPCEVCGIHFPWHSTHPDCKGEDWKPFHTADYYTCDDTAELLSHEDWVEALAEHADSWFDPQEPHLTIDEILEKQGSITVYAWKRKVLPTSFGFGEAAIDSMLEDFEEMYWCEEYGNAFEEGSPPWDEEALKIVKAKLYATMEECVQMAHIWQCEVITNKVFADEELVTLLKEHSPHWWEKK